MPAPVAVAIVSWNTRELLRDCLTSLAADHEARRADVWVIDNASSDGSAEMVREEFGWVELIASEVNLGFGPAVNVVARRARNPLVAPANSDLRFEPDALASLLRAADTNQRAGAFAPRLVTPTGETQHSVHPFPTPRNALLVASGLSHTPGVGRALALHGAWDPDEARFVDWAHGAFLLVRRVAWDAVEGFDDAQWLYAEDLDICWRLKQAGWPTEYVPDAVVHHHVSAATSGEWSSDERAVRSQRSMYAWLARRQGMRRARTVGAINVAGAVVRWLPFVPLARLAPERFEDRRHIQRLYVAMHRTAFEPANALARHRSARDA